MGKFLTTSEFINRAKVAHGNKYDYSLVDYINSKTKIKIICPEHGVFEQNPNDHIQKKGCIMCAGVKKKDQSEFVKEAKKIHGNKYDYSMVVYIDNKTKTKIICPIHGEFEQRPNDHLNRLGCSKCGHVKNLTTHEFIERAKEKHSNYDYSLVNYKNMHTKVKIICQKHGEFKQTPHNHLKFAGCPKCNKSKGEKIISWFLDKNNIAYEEQKKLDGCNNKSPLKFDFYLPSQRICIEFQGIQHYEEVKHMGGNEGLKKRQINDKIKRKHCKENNIKLIEVKYSDNICLNLKKELNIK